MRIGAAQWRDVRFGVADEPAFLSVPGPDVHGFLGNGFLEFYRREYEVTLDYPGKRVAFRRPGRRREAAPAQVPVSIENHYAVVEANVNGRGPFRFFLDTGASRCIIAPDAAGALSLPRGEPCRARGVECELEAYRTRVSALACGLAERRDMEVPVMDCSGVCECVGGRVDGYVGHDFLKHFCVTLDYADRVMRLEQGEVRA